MTVLDLNKYKKIMELKKDIGKLEDHISFMELSNDFYYTLGGAGKDIQVLRDLQTKLKELERE